MSEAFVKISESIIKQQSASFGQAIYPPRGHWGPAIQRGYQVVLAMSGSIELQAEGRTYQIPAGHTVLCEPYRKELFIFSPTSETQSLWCTVTPSLIPTDLQTRLKGSGCVIPISKTLHGLIDLGLHLINSPQVETSRHSLIESGQPHSLIKGVSRNAELDQLTHQLGLSVLQCFLADRSLEQTRREPPPVEKARHFIHENFAKAFALPELARFAGVTPNHLIKLFRTHAGMTPMEYLWQVRIDRGTALLQETGLSISEIAYQTGFRNPFHFSRRFTERYGRSPREFRRAQSPGASASQG